MRIFTFQRKMTVVESMYFFFFVVRRVKLRSFKCLAWHPACGKSSAHDSYL